MSAFLLELRCEEIPARMQKGARAELEKLFRRELSAAGVKLGELDIWSTPRRLALIARDLPFETEAVREEAKGPPAAAPDQAVDGFCRKNGVTRDQLEVREVKGRETFFAVKDVPGRKVADLLGEAIPAIIRDFSWPKSQRWGAASISTESLRWVRPLSGIIALFDGGVVSCEAGGISSGRATMGHRFHSSGAIEISSADDYADKLRAAHVLVDHEERQDIVRTGAAKAASDAGLQLIEDEGLVVENAGLTEWPVPLLGRFEEAYLDVPPEVIQLTARVNQKYFVCQDGSGKLANAFVCTANIASSDNGAAIVDGNRKVLAARLADARFFWELDQKTTLADHAKKLERITFHEKLGTVADKVERVAKLARWLVEEGIVKGADADHTEQAARLCKADLVTEMVGEFPDLQGLMGGYYAAKEGLPVEVSDAIRDHYKPVGQGDDVPTAPVTVAMSLADKLDTLFSFFAAELKPTGSKDPFALRRAGLSVLALLEANELRVNLRLPYTESATNVAMQSVGHVFDSGVEVTKNIAELALKVPHGFEHQIVKNVEDKARQELSHGKQAILDGFTDVLNFLADRLKVQQKEAGVRYDLIDAVFKLGGEDDLVRLLSRVHALQAFVETEDGTNLLAGYKRASNILKKEKWEAGDNSGPSYTPEPAELALFDALNAAEPKASKAIEAEDFSAAMAALASLRGPIDSFFDSVTVNDENVTKRAKRLDLLARFRVAVHNVADFSQIEG